MKRRSGGRPLHVREGGNPDWWSTQLPELCWFTSAEHAALLRMLIRRVPTIVISITNIRHQDTSGGVLTLELCWITCAIVASVVGCSLVRAIAAIVVSITNKLRGYATTWKDKELALASCSGFIYIYFLWTCTEL